MVARVTQVSRSSVTGALFRLWSLADEHTTDGLLVGYGTDDIDTEVGIPGFCNALSDPEIDWLCTRENGLQIKRFDEHNGDSAKSRAQATERQRKHRHASVTEKRDKSVTREEKRREEKNREETEPKTPDSRGPARTPAAGGAGEAVRAEAIYAAYPRKVGKAAALKAIEKAITFVARSKKSDRRTACAWLLERVVTYADSPCVKQGDAQYIPHPSTWFNEGRYDDHPDEWNLTRTNGTVHAEPTVEDVRRFLETP